MRIKYFVYLVFIALWINSNNVYAQSKKAEKTKKQTERSIERKKRADDRQLKRDIKAHKRKQTKDVQQRMDESRKKADQFNKNRREGIIRKWQQKRKLKKL